MTVVATRVGLLLTAEGTPIHGALADIIDIAQVTTSVLSLFINVLGTLIISNKAWCVDSILELYVCLQTLDDARMPKGNTASR
jgi:uncharacterized membrane protein